MYRYGSLICVKEKPAFMTGIIKHLCKILKTYSEIYVEILKNRIIRMLEENKSTRKNYND